MQIEINGKRNITLDFNAPKKFRLTQNGAEIPYVRTGKNSFRLSKNIDGVVDLEEIIEHPRYMQPVQLQPQHMTVINPQDVERLNEAVRQMALVNPNDVMIINQTAEQLEKNQNFIAQTQKEITDNQVYIDQQQQRLNESALNIQALETNNSQRLDSAETAIYSLAGEVENTKSAVIDGLNATLGKIDQQGAILQAEIDTKADKEELESLKKDIEEKSDRFSSAMANYSGGTAYDTSPQGGEAGQILAKRTDRQGDYIWIDQTPVIVKSETIPTASEKYKGEVYQYVGETGEYTHGYIYECQQNGTSYEWVRLDVQPNTAVWGQITGLLSDQTDLQEALDDKQDKLTQTQMDAVNSGANQSNIAQITTNKTNINTINSKIPAQASSSNQLADKEFVNSSISTNTAYFIGTFNSVAELEAYSGTLTNNDYAFVVRTDSVGNTVYDRYKYTDATTPSSWEFEYTLNNSSFTASQWQAINSGITDDLVGEFKAKGALLDYANDVLSLEDSDGNVLSSVTIQASAAADVVNYTNITNCITEIPQDIKLELNNGTLTLKAGSKVYVPNGPGVFNAVTINTDITTQGSDDTQYILIYSPQGGYIGKTAKSSVFSGPDGSSVSEYGFWYDTTNNIIKRKLDGVFDAGGYSLPFGLSTANSSGIKSIDQVFNGFGYIGSTVFALPGVKGLIPNGRNSDGSLKNIEFTVDKVITRTITWNSSAGQELFIGKYSLNEGLKFISTGKIGLYYIQDAEPTKALYAIWYKPSENKVYSCTKDSNDNLIWKDSFPCYIGQWFTSATSPYPITELTTKAAFHAVDWNDFNNTPHIVETYSNGASWYRVWSDGWIEQGGVVSSPATDSSESVSLLKVFTDTNYSLLVTENGTTINTKFSGNMTCLKRVSSFQLYNNGYGYSEHTVNWFACGY